MNRPQGDGSPQPAAGRPARARFAWVLLLVVADLWTKALAFGALTPGGALADRLVADAHGHLRLPLLGDWLALMLSLNPGAAFGGFADWPWALVIGRLAAVTYLAWLIGRVERGRRWFTAALVLILSGAIGNLYDNLRLARWEAWSDPARAFEFGKVRDFIDVYFSAWDWHFPTFNLADSCITVGAILLIGSGLFGRRHEETARGRAEGAAEREGARRTPVDAAHAGEASPEGGAEQPGCVARPPRGG